MNAASAAPRLYKFLGSNSKNDSSSSEFRADFVVRVNHGERITNLRYQFNATLNNYITATQQSPAAFLSSIDQQYAIMSTTTNGDYDYLGISMHGDADWTASCVVGVAGNAISLPIQVTTVSGTLTIPNTVTVWPNSSCRGTSRPLLPTTWDYAWNSKVGTSADGWGLNVGTTGLNTGIADVGRFILDPVNPNANSPADCGVTNRLYYQWVDQDNQPVSSLTPAPVPVAITSKSSYARDVQASGATSLENGTSVATAAGFPSRFDFRSAGPGYYKLMVWPTATSSGTGATSCQGRTFDPSKIADAWQMGSVWNNYTLAVPDAPKIVTPTQNQTVTTVQAISGTGTAGDTVTVREGSSSLCTALVATDSSWTCAPHAFSLGAHSITVSQTDPNSIAGPDSTATAFTVVSPNPVASLSTLRVSDGPKKANGTDAYTLTAIVKNAAGHTVPGALVTFQIPSDASLSATSCTTEADGACAVKLTSTTAGTYPVHAFLQETEELAQSPVSAAFTASAASPTRSTISASALSTPADGKTTSILTVRLIDDAGNPLRGGGYSVTLSTTNGSLGTVTNNGDGTYRALLTAPVKSGTGVVSFTVNGLPSTDTVTINFTPGEPSPSMSTIVANPKSVPVVTGVSSMTVTLYDGYGNSVTIGGTKVTVRSSAGTVSTVADNGNGTYAATLNASATAEVATVVFDIDGATATSSASVSFLAGKADPGKTLVSANPTLIPADGASQSAITVVLRDSNGSRLSTGGAKVALSTTSGTLSAVINEGNGSYAALLTSPKDVGSATVSASVDGVTAPSTVSISFVPGAASQTTSTIAANPTSITADGAATSTVTVTLRDAQGHLVNASGSKVVLTTTAGTLTSMTENTDGTLSATLTSATQVGTATITLTVNGELSPNQTSVTFTVGAASATRSTISASPTTVKADSSDASTITVRLFDAQGNQIKREGGTVVIASSLGTIGATTDNSDGTYTAQLTSTVDGVATLSFTVNASPAPTTAIVKFDATPHPDPVDPKEPTKSGVRPGNGPDTGGTKVTLTGTDLGEVTAVTFGGNPGTNLQPAQDGKSLTIVTPKHDAGTVDITVTNSAGTTTIPGGFRFDATPHPDPSNVQPGGPVGSGFMVLTGGERGVGVVRFGSLWPAGLAMLVGFGLIWITSLPRRVKR